MPLSIRAKNCNYVAATACYHSVLKEIQYWAPGGPVVLGDDGIAMLLDEYLATLNDYYTADPQNVERRYLSLTNQKSLAEARRMYHWPNPYDILVEGGAPAPKLKFENCPAAAVRVRKSGIFQWGVIDGACLLASDHGAVYVEGRDPDSECGVFACRISRVGPPDYRLWKDARKYRSGVHVDDGARCRIVDVEVSNAHVGININGHYGKGLESDPVSTVHISGCRLESCQIPIMVVGSPFADRPVIIEYDGDPNDIRRMGGFVDVVPC